ncbi:MAG: histidine--tRNA ligase [Fimbriimonadaceae bacterium]|nr:histidine--tRNA ligase [Alphaproteobacteria bacterium]
MAQKQKTHRVKARLPRGFIDRTVADLRATERMLAEIRDVYELYGFDPVETPSIEYTEALGKFLPDQDRPNAGVFSFQDDDEQWMSLRYDLTAPLARYVAENYDVLAKPYRSYRAGYVYRNEKPGPGRFRQFMQIDADTVGAGEVSADAEICMMTADCMERLGIARGDFIVRVNNRKVLDGVLETIGLGAEDQAGQRLTVLRAIDKLDRLGDEGVRALLGEGRKDESGDFTKGAGLASHQIERIIGFVTAGSDGEDRVIGNLMSLVVESERGMAGVEELAGMAGLFAAAGYGPDRIAIDPSVVRGLEYYTGPVYEVELTFETVNERGEKARFGSVAGGGRYDGLVARFKGAEVPATGISIGVSRLQAALAALGKLGSDVDTGPVVVLVMDRERIADYQAMTAALRNAGIRAEMYLGSSGMRAQMKYADRRGAPVVVIQGEDERAAGEVQIKDLIEGARLSGDIEDNVTWREMRPAQISVPHDQLVEAVRKMLANPHGDSGPSR